MRYLITGTAGFIGFHLAKRLLDDGHFVTGFDGMTPYYDVRLKERRHADPVPLEWLPAGDRHAGGRGALWRRPRRSASLTSSFTSQPRPAFATAWKIPRPMSIPT